MAVEKHTFLVLSYLSVTQERAIFVIRGIICDPSYSTCTLQTCFFVIFLSPGSTVEQFPWYLWWAAADVHCSGGGRICQGHPGEHAQHSGHWPVYGCGQTAVHCSHSWEPPLLLPRWDKCEGLRKVFCFPEDTKTTVHVNRMFISFSSSRLSSSLSLPSESRSILLPVVLHHIHLHLRQQRELLICSGILSSIFSIIKTSAMVQCIVSYACKIYMTENPMWWQKRSIELVNTI